MNYYEEHQEIEYIQDTHESGILKIRENTAYVNEKEVENNRGLEGDIVYIENNKVMHIKKRERHKIIGYIDLNSKYKICIPDFRNTSKNKIYHIFSPINKKYPNFYVSLNTKNHKGNVYVLIEFQKWEKKSKYPFGILIDVIGNVGILENDCISALHYCDVYQKKNTYIKEDYLKHQKQINDIQNENTDYTIFTIDPKGSKDLDDGFHFNKIDDTLFEVGIHIACPYIFLNDPKYIDNFFKRITTIYSHKNIHMMPDIYSNDLISLLQKQKRKSICLLLTFDIHYKLINKKVEMSTVYIDKNYDYETFFKETHENKNIKEFINFSNLYFKKELDSHKLVEEWMINANCLIVDYLVENNYTNIIVRVHEKNKNINYIEQKNDSYLTNLLLQFQEDSATYQLLNTRIDENQYHSKMGSHYTHFTSPIRRVVDFYTQGLIIGNLKIETDLLNKYILHVNQYQKKLKKFYNYQKKLELVHDHKEDKVLSDAYILKIKKNYIHVYIRSYNFQIKYNIFPYAFMKSYNPQYTHSNDENIKIECIIDGNKIMYELYQLLKVELMFFPFEKNINDKIKMKIIK